MSSERLQQLQEFLSKEPKDPFLNYALAMEYRSLGEQEKAHEQLLGLVEHNPEYTGTYYHLGYSFLERGERDQAVAIWEQGIAVCREQKKQHALSELQSALNNFLFEEDE